MNRTVPGRNTRARSSFPCYHPPTLALNWFKDQNTFILGNSSLLSTLIQNTPHIVGDPTWAEYPSFESAGGDFLPKIAAGDRKRETFSDEVNNRIRKGGVGIILCVPTPRASADCPPRHTKSPPTLQHRTFDLLHHLLSTTDICCCHCHCHLPFAIAICCLLLPLPFAIAVAICHCHCHSPHIECHLSITVGFSLHVSHYGPFITSSSLLFYHLPNIYK